MGIPGGVRRSLWSVALAALVAISLLVGCKDRAPSGTVSTSGGTSTTPAATTTLRIVATIPPIAGIVRPLVADAGLSHDLVTLVPAGASEHGFELTPEHLKALAAADVVYLVGLGMEPQVEKFLTDHPRVGRRAVILADALNIKADGHAHHHHDHSDDDDHHHHGADPHLWLDPVMVKEALKACAAALRPGLSEEAWARVEAARDREALRVEDLHRRYDASLSRAPRRTIIVGHDAYGYLSSRYNIEVVAISGINAGEPRPDDLLKAANAVRENGLTTIFIEPQLGSAAAERLAKATGAKIAVLDPLGDGDWFGLMEKNLAALKNALGVPPDPTPKPTP